ncbi:hypothetical protein OSB04_026571 [Centaurea solstitialis]|uniref:HMA domain-containing protein n=1 Tax=Centaurea solstitialis TaxID=347529 RepID=A0AA38W604_9ASTR|nr:hypothetical protein OSB04_026571 [Centaurea solstitialis]
MRKGAYTNTTRMTIFLQIIGFHNCQGCMRKVRIALRKIGGVELVELDPETGNVTVTTTTKHPEEIRYALERKMKKKVVIMSREIVPTNQNPNQILTADRIPTLPTFDFQDLGKVMLRLSQVLESVEVVHSNSIRVNFNPREDRQFARPESRGGVHIEDSDVEYAPPRPLAPRAPPWSAVEPSAPMIPREEEEVYGYPPEFYGYSSTSSHDHDHDHDHD